MHRGKLTLLLLPLLLLLLCRPVDCRKRHLAKKLKKLTERQDDLERRLAHLEKGSCQKRTECPVGYLADKRSCVQFVMGQDTKKPWTKAKSYCQNKGANLITIQSPRKLRFVQKYLEGNFNHSKLELFTGLIATDSVAEQPFTPHMFRHGHSTSTKDSVRWTATREAVIVFPDRPEPAPPHAKYHPKIHGSEIAGTFDYHSCVLLVWDPKNRLRHSRLIFRYGDCESRLSFVCEVQPPRWKCASPSSSRKRGRMKRSAVYGPEGDVLAAGDKFKEDDTSPDDDEVRNVDGDHDEFRGFGRDSEDDDDEEIDDDDEEIEDDDEEIEDDDEEDSERGATDFEGFESDDEEDDDVKIIIEFENVDVGENNNNDVEEKADGLSEIKTITDNVVGTDRRNIRDVKNTELEHGPSDDE